MGGPTTELVAVEVAPANPPRERKFQVVPVPGVFTRGRWRCVDYHDQNPPAELIDSILKFSDAQREALEAAEAIQKGEVTIEEVNAKPNVTVAEKESSTIVVTSIRPAPTTPQHTSRDRMDSASSASPAFIPSLPSIADIAPVPPPNFTSPQSSTSAPQLASVPSVAPSVMHTPHASSLPQPPNNLATAGIPIPTSNPTFEILSQVDVAASSTSDDYISAMARTPLHSNGIVGGQPHDVMVAPPTQHLDSPTDDENGRENSSVTVVAIDNKIEQAMDLVKTHLTFAVREEVEVLRTTISELENKVVQLESQNSLLRQWVPADVLNNLPVLIQQRAAAQQNSAAAQPPAIPPPQQQRPNQATQVLNLESTLNNVVAEVRQAVRGTSAVGSATSAYLSGTRPAHMDYSNQPAVQQLQQEIQNVAFGRQQQQLQMLHMQQMQAEMEKYAQTQAQQEQNPQQPQ